MTLIGRCRFATAPVMFGDVLLSNQTAPPSRPIAIPALSDVNAALPPEAWGYATGVTQKLNIPNDNLMIAWAGPYAQAYTAVRELHEAVLAGASRSEDALAVLRCKPENEVSGLSLLGMIVRPDGRPNGVSIASFAMNCETYEINGIDVRLSGSGEWHALQLLPAALTSHSKNGDYDNLSRAISFGASFGGLLIGREIDTGANLSEMWGGAIEVGYVANGKLTKLDKVLHVMWHVRRLGNDAAELVFWPRITHYRYVRRNLVVSVLDIGQDGSVSEHTYVIPPLFGAVAITEDDVSSHQPYAYDVLNCYISFAQGISAIAHASYVQLSDKAQNEITISRTKGALQITIEHSLVRNIQTVAEEHSVLPLVGR